MTAATTDPLDDPDLWLHDVPVMTITDPDGVERKWVDADAYVAKARERDDLNRSMAFVNAAVVSGDRVLERRILDKHGHTIQMGHTTRQIMEQFGPK